MSFLGHISFTVLDLGSCRVFWARMEMKFNKWDAGKLWGQLERSLNLSSILKMDLSKERVSGWAFHDQAGDPLTRWRLNYSLEREYDGDSPQDFPYVVNGNPCNTRGRLGPTPVRLHFGAQL